MLGKTHMAIGALGALVATPLLLHTHWVTLPQDLAQVTLLRGQPKLPIAFLHEAEWITAAIVGSLMPDFDEQHSLAGRKAEKTVQVVLIVALVALVWLLKLTLAPIAWVFIGVFGFGLLTRANLMRRIALGLIGFAGLYLGMTHHIPLIAGALYAVWCAFAAFTSHRTFSHSILGLLIFWYASSQSFTHFHLAFMGTAVGVGYLLHILADIPSGGVALAWPIPLPTKGKLHSPRFGGRLVSTGGAIDHLIGVVATGLFILMLFRPVA